MCCVAVDVSLTDSLNFEMHSDIGFDEQSGKPLAHGSAAGDVGIPYVDDVEEIFFVRSGQLDIAYERHGDPAGWPVVLMHGFPYDPRCYDDVVGILIELGADVVVPYMRGYGPTRYLDADNAHSGQQAAFAKDLRELIEGLNLDRPVVAGFDWGGRASCVTAILWPGLVSGLVSVGGYNVHNIAVMTSTPDEPAIESRNWYQWYFHSERGRIGLTQYRRQLAQQLWKEWSPTWVIPPGAFAATAVSFENPDFVATVIHSYRHRYGLTEGDPLHESNEQILAQQPLITVPTIVLDAEDDPLDAPQSAEVHKQHFTNLVDHRIVKTGHNPPQEDPSAFADAVHALTLHVR